MPGTDDAPARDVELMQKGRGLIPPQILDLVVPPIQVGSWCGEFDQASSRHMAHRY